jgi:hypothetical protein
VIRVAQGWEYDMMPTARYPGTRRVWSTVSGAAGFEPYDGRRFGLGSAVRSDAHFVGVARRKWTN